MEQSKEKRTRLYEVAVKSQDGKPAGSFLVEASSQSEAWDHVAEKFVGDVSLPNGTRIASLMAGGLKHEVAAPKTKS